jgi:hypothetical protein
MIKQSVMRLAAASAAVAVVASTALAGSMYEVRSPTSPCAPGFTILDPGNGKYYCDQTDVVVTEGAKTANPKSAPVKRAPVKTPPSPKQIASHERARGTQDQIAQIQNASTSVPSASANRPAIAIQSTVSKLKPDPEGNFFVVSYLDDPRTKTEHDRRLGKVKVRIKREGGPIGCSTHAGGLGATNAQSGRVKLKDGRQLLVKGTLHFANCDAGKYTVTVEGRKGYKLKLASKATQTLQLNDGETQPVDVVMVVDKKSKK